MRSNSTSAIVLLVASIGASIASVAVADESIPHLTTQQWREDIRYFASELTKNHRDPYHRASPEVFARSVASLLEDVPHLQDFEVMVGLQALAAQVGDGHTFLATGIYRRLPLELFWFGDDLRVVCAASPYQSALGLRLTAVNGVPIGEVQARLQSLIPQGENAWHVRDVSASLTVALEPLAAMKVIARPGPVELTFERDDGHSASLRMKPRDADQWLDPWTQPPRSVQFL